MSSSEVQEDVIILGFVRTTWPDPITQNGVSRESRYNGTHYVMLLPANSIEALWSRTPINLSINQSVTPKRDPKIYYTMRNVIIISTQSTSTTSNFWLRGTQDRINTRKLILWNYSSTPTPPYCTWMISLSWPGVSVQAVAHWPAR